MKSLSIALVMAGVLVLLYILAVVLFPFGPIPHLHEKITVTETVEINDSTKPN